MDEARREERIKAAKASYSDRKIIRLKKKQQRVNNKEMKEDTGKGATKIHSGAGSSTHAPRLPPPPEI